MEDLIQGSPEWLKARAGSLGASQVALATAKTKSGWGASRANVMAQMICERLTGEPTEMYTNAAMQWGNDTEPQARMAYELMNNVEVREVGIVKHPTIKGSHASPDGLVGDDGNLEIKCPNTATHIDTLLSKKVPSKYLKQIQWQMACTGCKWTDFVSFDPRLPEHLQMFVARIERDDETIKELENEVQEFINELELKISQLPQEGE